jgi:hypothetical protein
VEEGNDILLSGLLKQNTVSNVLLRVSAIRRDALRSQRSNCWKLLTALLQNGRD